VKKGLTIGASALAVAGLVSFFVAGTFERGVATAAEVVPAEDILVIVREMGLEPGTRVQQRGAYYVVHAVDPRGREVRVVADMRSGTILSVMPLRGSAVETPRQIGAARIIQVPQADEAYERATVHERRDGSPRRRDAGSRAAPRMTSTPPPAPVRQRTMLNVPREADTALTPVYPTPRFDAAPGAGDLFEQHGSDPAGDALLPKAD